MEFTREWFGEFGFEFFFLPTFESATEFAAGLMAETERTTVCFEEPLRGFRLFVVGCAPRPRPVVRTVETVKEES